MWKDPSEICITCRTAEKEKVMTIITVLFEEAYKDIKKLKKPITMFSLLSYVIEVLNSPDYYFAESEDFFFDLHGICHNRYGRRNLIIATKKRPK